MEIKLAKIRQSEIIINFFNTHINTNNDALSSQELICPFWTNSAIKRNELIIWIVDNEIISALRFYLRKKDNVISIYQFAIAENFRNKWLLKEMLLKTWYKYFESICPIWSNFNNYYKKTSWILYKTDKINNYWKLFL